MAASKGAAAFPFVEPWETAAKCGKEGFELDRTLGRIGGEGESATARKKVTITLLQ